MALVPASSRGTDPSAAVDSVFGRAGVVVAAGGDYAAAQVTNAFDKSADQTFGKTLVLSQNGQTLNFLNAGSIISGNGVAAAKLIELGVGTDPTTFRYTLVATGFVQYADGVNPWDASFGRIAAGVLGSPESIIAGKGTKTSAIAAGALPTVAPVSGAAFQCTAARDVHLVVPVTFNAAAADATCLVELSPDGVTFSALVTLTEKVGAVNGDIRPVSVAVPAGWRVRLTVANAVLGVGTYY